MTQEDFQKQIEAVRGLIVIHKEARNSYEMFLKGTESKYSTSSAVDAVKNELETEAKHLRNLVETLKPHLNGEKLEV